ncbi:MAG: helical backbone metal receptor [Flavobacteriales bacterium]
MPVVIDQMGRSVNVPHHPERIISLVPSQTELLHDLGLGERVVGITKFCIHPEDWFRTKARVGGTKQVDLAKVHALKPDLIIGNKEENAQADIETLAAAFPVWMSDVRDLDGALDMIRQVGQLTDTASQAEDIASRIATGSTQLVPLVPPLSAAYLIWRDPYIAVGPDTFINDMLRRCGLVNVFGSGEARYPELNAMDLAQADPDVILLSSEPYPFQEKHITEVNMICPGAPVRLVDGECFSWYGSHLLRAPAYFGTLLAGLVPPRIEG